MERYLMNLRSIICKVILVRRIVVWTKLGLQATKPYTCCHPWLTLPWLAHINNFWLHRVDGLATDGWAIYEQTMIWMPAFQLQIFIFWHRQPHASCPFVLNVFKLLDDFADLEVQFALAWHVNGQTIALLAPSTSTWHGRIYKPNEVGQSRVQ